VISPRVLRLALGLAACAAFRGEACRAAAWVPPDPGARLAAIVIAPPQTVYPLPDRFLIAGSDSARVRGRLLVRGRDYFLDAAPGTFRLNSALAPGDTVRVSYRILLAPLASANGVLVPRIRPPGPAADTSFALRDTTGGMPGGAATGPAAVRAIGSAAAPVSEGAALTLTGNKTVAVDFGNTRDVALRQSLDLHATGRVAPGVDVLAVLSDRNTPISGDGSTRELRELDKLLLEVKGPGAGSTLGDLTMAQEQGTFARFGRELSGVSAYGKVKGLDGGAVLAGVKGVFVSRQFQGTEGVQGPYVLSDDQGRTGILIVAGSEVVWLDGTKLSRGESADYELDYDRGQLTFSARRLISAASRIAIDYQVALSSYRRNVSQFHGGVTRGGLNVWGQLYREADAESRPLRTDLTDEDRLVLANAGNDPKNALGNGVSNTPGDYAAFNDTAGVTRFTFAGIGLGGYTVQFAPIGAGQGDYAESTQVQGRTIYHYVGAGQGGFTPGRLLPLPTALGVANGGFTFAPRSWAHLTGEFAGSRYDANTFSSLGDSAKNGGAAQLGLVLEGAAKPFGKDVGRVGVSGEIRRFDERYRAPGRLDPVYYSEEWGVNANRALNAQDRRGLALTWKPEAALALRAGYAELSADSGFFARRRDATADWTGRFTGHGRIERVDNRQPGSVYDSEGFRNKAQANANWGGTPFVRPEASLDFEDRVPPATSDSAAARYRQWDAGVTFPTLGPVALTLGAGQRFDAVRDSGAWLPRTRSDRVKSALAWHAGGRISGALGLERRLQRPDGAGAPPKTTSDAGYARFRQSFGARAGDHELALEWTNEAREIRERQIVFVGPGGGAYDSLGNFVGQGDYAVTQVATGEFERLVRTSGSYRFEFRPGSAVADSSAWSGKLAESRVSVLVQSTLGRRGTLEFADLVYTPKRLLARDDIAFGNYLIRPELEVGGRSRWLGFLFRVERRTTVDRQFVGQSTTRDEWTEEARWRTRPGPRFLSEVSGRFGQSEAEQGNAGFAGISRRLVAQGLTAEGTYLPSPEWRLGAVLSIDRADLADDSQDASRVLKIGPHLVYTRGGRFRSELQLRRAAIGGGALPVLVPSGFPVFPDQWDYTLETSLRVRERANLVLSGNGHQREGASFVHSGRFELRAYF
jgi:hypothetical protein